jgi:hypothetical protein
MIIQKDPTTDGHFEGTGKPAFPRPPCFECMASLVWPGQSDPAAARLWSRALPRLLSASSNLAL